MKIEGIDKSIRLDRYLEMLITEDDVLDSLYNAIFEKLVNDFKYYDKVDLFDKEKQKLAIRLDAIKLLNYYNRKVSKNPNLANDE